MDKQSITVQDVNLATDDVSRLRQAWDAAINPVIDSSGGSTEKPSSDGDPETRATCAGSATIVMQKSIGDGIRLVFAGKDLQEGRPLLGYGLGGESTVHVLGRLRGGAQLGKVVKGRSQVRYHTESVINLLGKTSKSKILQRISD